MSMFRPYPAQQNTLHFPILQNPLMAEYDDLYGWVNDDDQSPMPRQRIKVTEDEEESKAMLAQIAEDINKGVGSDSDDDSHATPPRVTLGMVLPSSLRPMGPAFPECFLAPNPANGDCQFWALAQALNNYAGSQYGALKHRLRLLKLHPPNIVAEELRELAYLMFLKSNPELDAQLEKWKLYSTDPAMADAYNHASFLQNRRIDALTLAERVAFFDILSDSRKTWGDETSLLILERLLTIRVDVLSGGYLHVRDMCHPPGFDPIVYCVMNLSLQHYECVVWQGPDGNINSAFTRDTVPPAISALHLTQAAVAKDAYIRLEAPPPMEMEYEDTFLAHFQACELIMESSSSIDSCPVPLSSFCMEPSVVKLKTVDADGGVQHPGTMPPVVHRLQCGIPVNSSTPIPLILAPADTIPSRIPYGNPARIW